MKKIIKTCLVLLFISNGYSIAALPMNRKQAQKLAFTDFSKGLVVSKKTPMVVLKLQSNPSTGFRWYLKQYNKGLLNLIDARYYAPDDNKPGAAGFTVWRFHVKANAALGPRVTDIKLVYARTWDLNTIKSQIVTLFIKPD